MPGQHKLNFTSCNNLNQHLELIECFRNASHIRTISTILLGFLSPTERYTSRLLDPHGKQVGGHTFMTISWDTERRYKNGINPVMQLCLGNRNEVNSSIRLLLIKGFYHFQGLHDLHSVRQCHIIAKRSRYIFNQRQSATDHVILLLHWWNLPTKILAKCTASPFPTCLPLYHLRMAEL